MSIFRLIKSQDPCEQEEVSIFKHGGKYYRNLMVTIPLVFETPFKISELLIFYNEKVLHK